MMSKKNVTNAPDYITYPRTFENYKWFKPLLVALLFGVFYVIFVIVDMAIGFAVGAAENADMLSLLSGMKLGYEGFNIYSAPGAVIGLGNLVVAIPALFVASKIIKDRPFSSYTSVRGGWNWKLFGKYLGIALIINGIPNAISMIFIEGRTSAVKFTILGFIICTFLGPLQCMAEEYIFRGFIMQTVGAWFRIPLLAIAIETVVFAALHPYNLTGVLVIAISGIAMGLTAWMAGGLEASGAIHIANNMVSFYLTGFGFGRIGSEISTRDLVLCIIINVLYVFVVYRITRKQEDKLC